MTAVLAPAGPAAPTRFDPTGRARPHSRRWRIERLNRPNPLWGSNGVAFGPDGRLYVAQFLAGQISAVDPVSGEIETVVPLDGPVQAPDDLAFGADGSMYIADLPAGRVWRRTPAGAYHLVSDEVEVPNGITCVGDRLFVNEMRVDGRLLELFPDGSRGPRVVAEGLAMGNAMQQGPDGLLYYPQIMVGELWRVPPDGGVPELVASDVPGPVGARFDRDGTLVGVSSGMSGQLTRIDVFGDGRRSVLATGVLGIDNLAIDAANRMFLSSYAGGGVTVLRPDGRSRELVPQSLNGPFGVTADARGTVYAADHYRLGRVEGRADGGVQTLEIFNGAHGVVALGRELHLTSETGEVLTYHLGERAPRVRAAGLRLPMGIAVGAGGVPVVAETGAGRVVAVPAAGGITVLAAGLDHPVDVAFDEEGRCYVSEERRGAVLRVESNGALTTFASGLGGPQGLVVRGSELFTVETEHRRLVSFCLETGRRRVEAERLPVGLPPGIEREEPDPVPGVAGRPRRFAGLAAAPDGSLLLSANGEGTVLRLSPR
ncbi:virginiamycin B lyase family protein [Streptomyces xiamenensis]|uniref:virginiamycin B lyase family protein n=1 Tax=Streptomyces xiamenensis TaxID=408015 RepID=UPI0037D2FA70